MSNNKLNTVSASVDNQHETDKRKITRAHSRRQETFARKTQIYFLTIPGMIRLLEIFFSGLHIGAFSFYSTYYEGEITEMTVPPFFLAATREAFFLLINFHTFMCAFTIVIASVISIRSHAALVGSLYVFVFDFMQFLLLIAASIGLILLCQEEDVKRIYDSSVTTRQGLSVTGLVLAILHLIGSLYDIGIYVQKTEARSMEPSL